MKGKVLLTLLLRSMRGDTERALLEAVDYLMAKSRALKRKYEQNCGKRLLLNDEQRRDLAMKGRAVIRHGYKHVIQIVKPDTLMRWHRMLVAQEFDGSKRRVGRPEVPPHVCKLVLRFARENRSWGYDRIAEALSNLGYQISDQRVADILERLGLEPSPERTRHDSWKKFIERHRDAIWASDLFTVEVLTLQG